MSYAAVLNALQGARTVLLSSHVSPDGDTLGSMLAFRWAIAKVFPQIKVLHTAVSGRIADLYGFMPGVDEVMDTKVAQNLMEQYDLAFSFDCGAIDRLGDTKPHFEHAKTSINVDHHISNDLYGDINIVEADASASGEVVARMLKFFQIPLDQNTAINLYVAILTDTGGFKYANTNMDVFQLAGELVQAGADPEDIYKRMYDNVPKCQALLQAHMMSQAQFAHEDSLAWAIIPRSVLQEFQAADEHLEGLVESLRRIQTVKVSAIFKENVDGSTKLSLRSDVPSIDVAAIAGQFGGGGHKMAAGCTIKHPPQQASMQVLPLLEEAVKPLLKTV